MPYCSSCGKEVNEGNQFCPNCGSSVGGASRRVHAEPGRRERDACFGSQGSKACFGPTGSGTGLWGVISGGVFIIGLGILWYFDWFWPGILILIALMAIIGGIVSYTRR